MSDTIHRATSGRAGTGARRIAAGITAVALSATAVVVAAGPASAQSPVPSGTVASWSNGGGVATASGVLQVPSNLGAVTAISAGVEHALALRPNGEVVAWGKDNSGDTAVPAAATSGVTAIAAGYDFSLALKADGTVIGWGDVTLPEQWRTGVVKIDAFGSTAMILKADGSAYGSAGDNSNQSYTVHGDDMALLPLTIPSGVKDIAAGGEFYGIVTTDGAVQGFTGNSTLQVASPAPASLSSGVVSIDGSMRLIAAVKCDGSVEFWGNAQSQTNGVELRAVPAAALSGVTKVALGPRYALALKDDGTVIGWGETSSDSAIPVPAERTTNVVDIAAGRQFGLVAQQVAPAPIPALTITGQPETAQFNTEYLATYKATGAPGATIALTAGALPPGVTLLDPSGRVWGWPQRGGDYTFTLTASAPGATPASITSTIRVNQAPTITNDAPSVQAGTPYSFRYTATGYPQTVAYSTIQSDSVVEGPLPAGLSLSADGVLSGTPTTPGFYSFRVHASNDGGSTDRTEQLYVFGAPTITGDPADGTVGASYTDGFTKGGFPNPDIAVTAGALPGGLSLNSTTAAVTGTPTAAGRYPLTVSASLTGWDGYAAHADHETAITVNPATSGFAAIAAPPASVDGGAWEKDDSIRVFGETYNHVLTADLTVAGKVIPAGSRVARGNCTPRLPRNGA